MISVLFVCMGNICRSPALQATLKKMIQERGLDEKIFVDSCGVDGWFLGSQADPKMVKAAKTREILIDTRAKLFETDYFDKFDYIFVVDKALLNRIKSFTFSDKGKVKLATEFSHRFPNKEIPDPYGGGEAGFESAMEMIEDACKGIIQFLGEK